MTTSISRIEPRVRYVLSADTVLLDSHSVPGSIADRFEAVISREHARLPSRALSRELAELVQEFSRPTTIVDAIGRYCSQRNLNPHSVIERALEPLEELFGAGYLQAEGDSILWPHHLPEEIAREADAAQLVTTKGAAALFRIVHRTHGVAAVRLVQKDDQPNIDRLVAEQSALRRLAGCRVPRLLHTAGNKECFWHISSWIDGRQLGEVIHEMRRRPMLYSTAARGLIAVSLLELLASIHECGVVHGDVNPKNFVVQVTGEVCAIDFESTSTVLGKRRAILEASPFYVAPEQVVRQLRIFNFFEPTAFGEQYSAAVVIAEVLWPWFEPDLGASLETLLHRVSANQLWADLSGGGDRANPITRCLLKALSPAETDRFSTLRAFAQSLTVALAQSQSVTTMALRCQRWQSGKFCGEKMNQLLARFAVSMKPLPSMPLHEREVGRKLVATQFFGPVHLTTVPELIPVVLQRLEETHRPVRLEDTERLSRLFCIGFAPGHRLEGIASGDGARLQVLSFLAQTSSVTAYSTVGAALLERNLDYLDESKCAGQFGVAHGLLGNALAAAVWCNIAGPSLPERVISPIMERLARELHVADGEETNTCDGWWCRGLPGYICLLIQMRRSTVNVDADALIEHCAVRLLGVSYSDWTLCCGLLGQAVALWLAAEVTSDERCRTHARQRLIAAEEMSEKKSFVPSVWKGHYGIPIVRALFKGEQIPGSALFGWT